MRKLHALGAASALILSYTLPAQAEECGRWVPCSDGPSLNAADLNAYIYGNKTEIEPWIAETKKSDKKTGKKAAVKTVKNKSDAPSQLTMGTTSQDVKSLDEAGKVGDLTAEEENELLAELARAESGLIQEDLETLEEAPADPPVTAFGITGTTKETGLTGVKVLSSSDD